LNSVASSEKVSAPILFHPNAGWACGHTGSARAKASNSPRSFLMSISEDKDLEAEKGDVGCSLSVLGGKAKIKISENILRTDPL
jgi:hypothetical protein